MQISHDKAISLTFQSLIFIFANLGFNFQTFEAFSWFKDKSPGVLLARPSNPFIKNIHPSYPTALATALLPLSLIYLFVLRPPSLLHFDILSSRSRCRFRISPTFFIHRVSLFCIPRDACNRQSTSRVESAFSFRGCLSNSSILDRLV